MHIAWVFGMNGKNFIKTMLSLGEKYDALREVSDQIGTPTYSLDLARLLADMIETEVRLLSRDERGRVHRLVRLCLRDISVGGRKCAGVTGDYIGVRTV